jgi:hypothetical protein
MDKPEFKDGRMENWKNGRMEEWKIGTFIIYYLTFNII